MTTLRPYQTKAIADTRAHISAGRRRVVIVAPTGAGKTTIAAEIIHGAMRKNKRVVFMAHRQELIDQASQRLAALGIDHGIIKADDPRRRHDAMVHVASTQTVVRRLERLPVPDLVVSDECHRAVSDSHKKVLEHWKTAASLGLTATPYRSDGRGLGELYDAMVLVASPRALIDEGYLLRPRVFAPSRPSLRKIKVSKGDYDPNSAAEAMGTASITGKILEQWKTKANCRTIVFCCTIAHSKKVCEAFLEAGIRAEHLDGEMPPKERLGVLSRLASGATTVVCNVGVLTEGYDLPMLGCVVLARPTQSCGLYLQMVGRVMRPAPGKPSPIVLDHVGAVHSHGLPEEDREFTLDDAFETEEGEGLKPAPKPRICPECLGLSPAGSVSCVQCGASLSSQRPLPYETDDDLKEVRSDPKAIDRPCAKCDSPVNISRRGDFKVLATCTACRKTEYRTDLKSVTPSMKYSEYTRLCAVAAQKGYKKGWAAHQYRMQFGVWPRKPKATANHVLAR